MKSELIVDVQPSEVSIALLEDGRLVSLQKEQRNIAYAVGDIYLAKVKKLMPGLNAAFVNVGYEKDAFLHYLDLGARYSSYSEFLTKLLADKRRRPELSQMKLLPDIDKHGTITDMLEPGKELLVQIVKEPISSKGPRLTTELTFTGRYMVLTPFCDKISVSQKIKSAEEKLRLRKTIESIKERNYGVIIRTSAEGKNSAELYNEFKTLVRAFENCCAKAQKVTAPALVFEEESRIVGMLRDVFSPSFENIFVNDAEVCAQIKNYVSLIAPERADIVKTYTKPEPIFDSFGITRQIKSSFGKTVSFKNGAYIIIEHTEALHVIDVNSGNRTKAGNDQETNALEVNLRAADEIARQLRLRDMGGIIVVDFIDMAKPEHRQELYEHMREVMANDRARHNILPLSKFGLMQITRQRVRPALDITVNETCPSCFGKGEVQPSLLFTDTLYEKLEYIVKSLGHKNFTMYVHPYVEAYLKKGWLFSTFRQWRRQLGVSFKLIADQSLAYLEYKVIDKDGNALQLREEKDLSQSSATKTQTKARTRGADEAEAAEKAPKKKRQDQPKAAESKGPEAKAAPAPKKSEKPAAPESKAAKPAKKAEAAKPVAPAEPESVVQEPEIQEEIVGEEGEVKLSKSQRRRRARKRSKEAAKIALEEAELDREGAEGQKFAEGDRPHDEVVSEIARSEADLDREGAEGQNFAESNLPAATAPAEPQPKAVAALNPAPKRKALPKPKADQPSEQPDKADQPQGAETASEPQAAESKPEPAAEQPAKNEPAKPEENEVSRPSDQDN